jgi:hypothetical protein
MSVFARLNLHYRSQDEPKMNIICQAEKDPINGFNFLNFRKKGPVLRPAPD